MAGAHTAIVSFHNNKVKAVNCECGINIKLRDGENIAQAWQRHNLAVLNARFDAAMGRTRG